MTVWFDTEREAEQKKMRYKKYSNTKRFIWTVQGNSLVKINRRIPNITIKKLSKSKFRGF